MKKEFYSYERDGITQSLLGTFMSCRQMAYWQLQGWTRPSTSMGLTYGTIMHAVLEKVYGQIQAKKLKSLPEKRLIKTLVGSTEKQWFLENPKPNKYDLENLQTSLLIAEATLPVYFEYWEKEDFNKIKWQSLEQEFKIVYVTKDGRKTFVRGKKDGVFGNPSLKLFETKTKSMFNEDDLIDTLWFELQVNLYTWAMEKTYGKIPSGILYNIIRRSNLRRGANETMPSFATRISKDIEKRPDFYFVRMEVKVDVQQMAKFKVELEAMITDFMDWWDAKMTKTYKNTSQCLNKYGRCQFLDLCSDGNFSRYAKRKSVFNELSDF